MFRLLLRWEANSKVSTIDAWIEKLIEENDKDNNEDDDEDNNEDDDEDNNEENDKDNNEDDDDD